MYLIVLANIQTPGVIHSFGNIPCTRDSFKRVILAKIFFEFIQFDYKIFYSRSFIPFRRAMRPSLTL